MGENLKNKLIEIIQRQPNCSKLNFDINIVDQVPQNAHQFPTIDSTFKKIDIVCSDVKLDSFMEINNEIKETIKEIEKLNCAHLVHFIFKKCYVKFWNESINLDWNIKFNECNINVLVQDESIDEIYLLTTNFINCSFENLSLLSGEVNTVQIDLFYVSIDLFQIAIIKILDNGTNKIKIKNSKITKIMIQSTIFKYDFAIHNTNINAIIANDVDFEALFEFNEVTFQDEFDFNEITYKGFTLFDKCIFNTKANFEYIIFEKFTSFRGSTFNKGLNLDYTSGDKEINFFGICGLEGKKSKEHTSRETYRIIKNNFEKNGNKIEANKYHALELDQKRRELEKNKWQNKLDYIVFKIHDLSSEHSTNWFLALFWIFLVSFLTNIGLSNELSINCLFKYINILSSVDDFKKSYVVMVLNKVLLGYLYYQFVTATRKDTRK
ncbi:MAG: pentapeptide repeat-containing protein [Sulfuricurvum sp.]|nr:pentapeptide repeat-containing protein [Sulfuricurvum sp.]